MQAAHWDARVVAAVALHPTRTASITDADHAEIERLAADPRVVAVGETGLDHYWDYSPRDAQERAFRWHIDLAKRLGKPLMIHDRDAHDDVLRRPRRGGRAGRPWSSTASPATPPWRGPASTPVTCCPSPGR